MFLDFSFSLLLEEEALPGKRSRSTTDLERFILRFVNLVPWKGGKWKKILMEMFSTLNLTIC